MQKHEFGIGVKANVKKYYNRLTVHYFSQYLFKLCTSSSSR